MTQRPPVLDDLSVVIPMLGRPILARSLAAIEAGTHWPAAIVVVDQGRDAATATSLDEVTQRGLPIEHVLSDQRGRARGVRALFVPEAVGYHRVSHTFGGGRYSEEYAKHKARNWFTFLRRHAPFHHKLGFFLIRAPLLALRLIVRESRRGNFGAIRGMVRGVFEIVRPKRAQR